MPKVPWLPMLPTVPLELVAFGLSFLLIAACGSSCYYSFFLIVDFALLFTADDCVSFFSFVVAEPGVVAVMPLL
jgi:hypothetical protein